MNPALLVRLRPLGPWRFGPSSGARDRVDFLLHSDVVYSAVTLGMEQLGWLDEWLAATANAQAPEVVLSSLYPFMGRSLFAVPPRHLWPPPGGGRVRWKGARFIPLSAVNALMREQPLQEERWAVDPVSQCLLSTDRSPTPPGPFRVNVRSAGAVDRVTQSAIQVHATACLEFAEGAGLWCAAAFSDNDARARWADRIKAVFRLLADSGVGGERSRGWGRASDPEFSEGNLNDLLFPPSQKLKDLRRGPKPPREEPVGATVKEPAKTEPMMARSLNNPLDPDQPPSAPAKEEPELFPEDAPSLNNPLDPDQPPGKSAQALNDPLDPDQPAIAPDKEEIEEDPDDAPSLNNPLDPDQPPAKSTQALNDPLDPDQPAIAPDKEEIEEDPEEAPSLNNPLDPDQPPAAKAQALNDPLDPDQPKGNEVPTEPEDEPEPSQDEPGPEPSPETEPGPEPPEQLGVTWEPVEEPKPGKAYWLLSVYTPGQSDSVDWSRGNYALLERSGRIQSAAAPGTLKKNSQMVEEGSVLFASNPPKGGVNNVAPDGFAHPVFRSGIAMSVEVPWRVQA